MRVRTLKSARSESGAAGVSGSPVAAFRPVCELGASLSILPSSARDDALVVEEVCEADLAAEGITGTKRDFPVMKLLEPFFVLDGRVDDGVAVGELPLGIAQQVGLSDGED
jgi:hypothetical protein